MPISRYTMADISVRKELPDLEKVFAKYDTDKDGTVNTSELLKMCEDLEQPATEDEVDFVIEQFDANGDGKLDYSEFVGLMQMLRRGME
ncbi:hypothetical protein BGZ99_007544 [Dissophora globulifera]|uniref:EF-hand domain-containing protein n=1 Tax=Dissophora globulifera TaxID=979702 RepID=A0A9P6UPL0_9FUNG|nr:hypothetical protein BGZ99_007544 [Dissophora globulifera]